MRLGSANPMGDDKMLKSLAVLTLVLTLLPFPLSATSIRGKWFYGPWICQAKDGRGRTESFQFRWIPVINSVRNCDEYGGCSVGEDFVGINGWFIYNTGREKIREIGSNQNEALLETDNRDGTNDKAGIHYVRRFRIFLTSPSQMSGHAFDPRAEQRTAQPFDCWKSSR